MGKAKARKKIAGLEKQVKAHELKLKNEPQARSAKHWEAEIANWQKIIKRRLERLKKTK